MRPGRRRVGGRKGGKGWEGKGSEGDGVSTPFSVSTFNAPHLLVVLSHSLQMTVSKAGEMFAEATPAGVLQMYAFVISPNRSSAAAGSIIISALTTGFGAALISYGESVLMYKVRWHFLVRHET